MAHKRLKWLTQPTSGRGREHNGNKHDRHHDDDNHHDDRHDGQGFAVCIRDEGSEIRYVSLEFPRFSQLLEMPVAIGPITSSEQVFLREVREKGNSHALPREIKEEPMTPYIVGAVIAQAVISGFLCGYLAEQKGYSTGAWFVVGLLFGVLGLIASAGLPIKSERAEIRSGSFDDTVYKRCPHCGKLVRRPVRVCPQCQHELE